MERTILAALLVLASVAMAGSAAAAADPTLHEVYQAAEAGHFKQADAMMDQVLKDHPNSAKAHFVEAELLAKEGRADMAKAELATAERLSPGLAFAKPEAVRALQARLAPAAAAAPAARSQAPRPANDFPWGFLLLGGFVVAAFVFFLRSLMRPRLVPASGYGVPAAYGPGGAQTFGAGGGVAPMGVGPMGPMSPMGAPGGGMGSGILGGLATGAAVGAGMVAGEALMHRVFDGGGHQQQDMQQQPFQSFDAPASLANDDMGGADFGVADGGSWDDGGASGGGGDDWS
ncbi:MAG: tetratricopeptide repeat protein [Rhodocyclaceae bacterium]|nr:tetratricopeptide repeat protein [Rhodocyclaceae bacterium]